MENIKVDFSKVVDVIRPMHSVNNGPTMARDVGTYTAFEEAKIPYARLHDASFFSGYGGEHTVDVHRIFPDFDKDPYDPSNYDFACTDKYLADIISTGCKPYYRLGASIEHGVKKYGTLPPKDYLKWAQICEGIIRHYTEGWADGFNYDIEYWEIWNEPNLQRADGTSPTWSGSMEEFSKFFKTALLHLKGKFPHLKIGGPALCSVSDPTTWEPIIAYIAEGERAQLDFISWHMYGADPEEYGRKSKLVLEIMAKYGYTDVESHLNEWNYVKDWKKMSESFRVVMSLKGAAYTAASMCVCQNYGVHHLMYYDARPNNALNGMFAPYTFERLKGYYPFPMFNKVYELKNQVYSSDAYRLYNCAASDGNSGAIMVSYFDDDDTAPDKTVKFDISGFTGENGVKLTVHALDAENDFEPVREEIFTAENYAPIIKIKNQTVLLLTLEKM